MFVCLCVCMRVCVFVCVYVVFNILKALQEYRSERQISGGVVENVTWGEFCAIAIEIYSLKYHQR